MKNQFFSLLTASFLLFPILSCNIKQAKEGSGDIKNVIETKSSAFFTIDFAEIIEHKRKVLLSEIAEDVEFIEFENSGKALLGNVLDIQLTPEFIFIRHSGSRLLTQFNRDGKFIRHIGTEGRGPKEYNLMRTFSLDEEKRLIYIQTNWTQKILVYNFKGEYIRTIKSPTATRLCNVWSRDSFMVSYSPPDFGNNLYSFIETSFSGDTTQKIKNHILWDKKENRSVTTSYWGRNEFYRVEGKLNMKDWYNDTVYTYNSENKIVPKFFIDLKEHKIPDDLIPEKMSGKPLPGQFYWVGVNESKDYIFIRYGLHGFRKTGEGEYGCVLFNKKIKDGVALKNHGEEYGFVNDLNGGPDFKPRYSNDSLVFVDISALDMKLYLNSEKFTNQEVRFPERKEKLKDLGKTLKEDDNHFLMTINLKTNKE